MNGKAIITTKLENGIFLNLVLAFSSFDLIFPLKILYIKLLDKYENNKYEIKHPVQVAHHEIKIPTIKPKELIFKATKTPSGSAGIIDSNRISKKPNKIPPDDIKEVQKSTKEFTISTIAHPNFIILQN